MTQVQVIQEEGTLIENSIRLAQRHVCGSIFLMTDVRKPSPVWVVLSLGSQEAAFLHGSYLCSAQFPPLNHAVIRTLKSNKPFPPQLSFGHGVLS